MLDEGSSTDGSEIMVARPGDDSFVSEEDWGVVSMDGSNHSEHSGELILDGVEDELVIQPEQREGSNDTAEMADSQQLSVPGADSVPTVVGSIDGLPAEEEAAVAPSDDTDPVESPTPTCPDAVAEYSPAVVDDAETAPGIVDDDAEVETPPGGIVEDDSSSPSPNGPSTNGKKRLAYLLVPALLLVPTAVASVCLYNERNSLQMSVLELEDVVSGLHLEAEQRKLEEDLLWEDKEFLQLSALELQEKVFALKREAEQRKKQEQHQLDTLHKERATLKLYVLHLQDLVSNLKKKAAKTKRQGDVLFHDKKFLQWSASMLEQKVKNLKLEVDNIKREEALRLEAIQHEKSSLQDMVVQAQEEVVRVQKEADKKLREEELRWNSLFQEKISLRVSTARLEEQVSRLKKKAKYGRKKEEIRQKSLEKERDTLLSTVVKLEREVATLKKKKQADYDFLNWDSCGSQSGDTILADNCWLNAKANIQLGECANDAKDVVHNALHDFSESVSHWMDSYSTTQAANKKNRSSTATNSTSTANTGDSVALQVMRKVDYFGKKLWDATATKSTSIPQAWNATNFDSNKQVSTAVGGSVVKIVDSLGRALWNATAFKMPKSSTSSNSTSANANTSSTNNQVRSFFSRMDLNGKVWFESFFAPSSRSRSRPLYGGAGTNKHQKQVAISSGLDKIFQRVSDVILSAGSADQILEEASAIFFATTGSSNKNSNNNSTSSLSLTTAMPGSIFMSCAMEKLCSAMAFNHTSKKYLMQVTKNAFEEVSLTHVPMPTTM